MVKPAGNGDRPFSDCSQMELYTMKRRPVLHHAQREESVGEVGAHLHRVQPGGEHLFHAQGESGCVGRPAGAGR